MFQLLRAENAMTAEVRKMPRRPANLFIARNAPSAQPVRGVLPSDASWRRFVVKGAGCLKSESIRV